MGDRTPQLIIMALLAVVMCWVMFLPLRDVMRAENKLSDNYHEIIVTKDDDGELTVTHSEEEVLELKKTVYPKKEYNPDKVRSVILSRYDDGKLTQIDTEHSFYYKVHTDIYNNLSEKNLCKVNPRKETILGFAFIHSCEPI